MTTESRTRWPVVMVAFLTGVIAAMQVGKAPPVIDTLAVEFDLGLTMAGWVLSTVAATGAVIGLFAGSLSDRIGHRHTIVFSLLLIILGCLMGANSGNITWLLLSRGLESTGFVGVVVSVPSILMRIISPSDQRLVFGMWAGYMPLGMAAMMAASPLFLTLTDWRGIWYINAVIALLGLIAFQAMTRDLKAVPGHGSSFNLMQAITRVLSRPGPWLMAGCFLFYAAQWAALMAWLPTFLTRISGSDLSLAAWLTALVVVVNVPGNVIGGWLLHRGATRWHLVAVGSISMAACGYGIFIDGISDVLRIVLAVAFSFMGGLLPGTLLSGAILHSPSPELRGTTNGVIINGANTGTLLGPPALGTMVALFGGWHASGIAIAIGGTIVLLLSLLMAVVEKNMNSSA